MTCRYCRLADGTDHRWLIVILDMAQLIFHPCAAVDLINSFRGTSPLSSRLFRAKLASLPVKTFVSPWHCLITPRLSFSRSNTLSSNGLSNHFRNGPERLQRLADVLLQRYARDSTEGSCELDSANRTSRSERRKHLGVLANKNGVNARAAQLPLR